MIREHKPRNGAYIDVCIAPRVQCLRKLFVREFNVSLKWYIKLQSIQDIDFWNELYTHFKRKNASGFNNLLVATKIILKYSSFTVTHMIRRIKVHIVPNYWDIPTLMWLLYVLVSKQEHIKYTHNTKVYWGVQRQMPIIIQWYIYIYMNIYICIYIYNVVYWNNYTTIITFQPFYYLPT